MKTSDACDKAAACITQRKHSIGFVYAASKFAWAADDVSVAVLCFSKANVVICRRVDAIISVTDKLLQDLVSEALRQLHGYIGGAVRIDLLLRVDATAIVRVDKRYSKVTRFRLQKWADTRGEHVAGTGASFGLH